eukprot:768646-Hanusia_phi.AAC.7
MTETRSSMLDYVRFVIQKYGIKSCELDACFPRDESSTCSADENSSPSNSSSSLGTSTEALSEALLKRTRRSFKRSLDDQGDEAALLLHKRRTRLSTSCLEAEAWGRPTSAVPVRRALRSLAHDIATDICNGLDEEEEGNDDGEGLSPTVPLSIGAAETQAQLASNISIDMPESELVEIFLQLIFPSNDPDTPTKLRKYRFDVRQMIKFQVRKLKSARVERRWKRDIDPSPDGDMPEIIAGGMTQNGKTRIKLLAIIVGHLLGVSSIIISTTRNGTTSLSNKMESYLHSDLRATLQPEIKHISELEYRKRGPQPMCNFLRKHGCLFVNDTAKQISNALEAIVSARTCAHLGEDFPCQLILDEADSYYRNSSELIKLEQELRRLHEEVKPVLRWNVSATLIPVFLHLRNKRVGLDSDSIIYTQPDDKYVGVRDFKPLQIDGKDQFLRPKDLTPANLYSNYLTDEMIKQAVNKPRSLTLVITNPRVNAANNVFELARRIQNSYPSVATLLVVGEGRFYYPPPRPRNLSSFAPPPADIIKTMGVSATIQMIDEHVGLDTPLIVLGYSQMIRGDTFRSDRRVPTHIICSLGPAMSIEKMVQAMGRASYQDSKLQDNGFNHVTVLTYPQDYDSAQAYPQWLAEMQQKLQSGMGIGEATSSMAVYSDHANVVFRQTKSIGQRKDNLTLDTSFEDPEPGRERRGRKFLDRELAEDPQLQLLLDIARQHAESRESYQREMEDDSYEIGITARTFTDAYNESSENSAPLKVQSVSRHLERLVANGVLKKFKNGRKPAKYWMASKDLLQPSTVRAMESLGGMH